MSKQRVKKKIMIHTQKVVSHIKVHHRKYLFGVLGWAALFKSIFVLFASVGIYHYGIDHNISANYTEISFSSVTWAELSTEYISEWYILDGVSTGGVVLSISGGVYSLNQSGWTNSSWIVYNGDNIMLKLISASWYLTEVRSKILLDTYISSFSVITKDIPFVVDITPDLITFDIITGASLMTGYESEILPILGINTWVDIYITWWEYRVNGGDWTSSGDIVYSEDAVQQRLISSVDYWILLTSSLSIWTEVFDFSVETLFTGTVNTGTVNTGTVNTGTVNTGTVNTGTVNTGTVNTGTVNTGTVNTGTVNTGTVNTGTVNTGTVNTGTVNTGTIGAEQQLSFTGISFHFDDKIQEDGFIKKLLTFQFENEQNISASLDIVKINWKLASLRSQAWYIYIYEILLDWPVLWWKISYDISASVDQSWTGTKRVILDDVHPLLDEFMWTWTVTGFSLNYLSNEYVKSSIDLSGVFHNINNNLLNLSFTSWGIMFFTWASTWTVYDFSFFLSDFVDNENMYTGKIIFDDSGIISSDFIISLTVMSWTVLSWMQSQMQTWSDNVLWFSQLMKKEFDTYKSCMASVPYEEMKFKIDGNDLSFRFPIYETNYVKQIVLFFVNLVSKHLSEHSELKKDDLEDLVMKLERVLYVVKLWRDSHKKCGYRLWNYYISSFQNTLEKYEIFIDRPLNNDLFKH